MLGLKKERKRKKKTNNKVDNKENNKVQKKVLFYIPYLKFRFFFPVGNKMS